MKIDPMPRVLVWVAVLSTIIMGIFEPVVAFTEDLNSESIRADLCMVVDVNRETHEVSIINFNGDIFVFEEDDEWNVGDFAVAVFEIENDSDVTKWRIVAVFYERPDLVVKQGFGFCFDSDAQISPARGD